MSEKITWSEFKKLVDAKVGANDPTLEFILFDVDYRRDKLYVFVDNNGQKLSIEG
ncbi:Uncharacterised protein [uncultured archaeon]|nr:Uncharacterised protein [uncultured archaeon]